MKSKRTWLKLKMAPERPKDAPKTSPICSTTPQYAPIAPKTTPGRICRPTCLLELSFEKACLHQFASTQIYTKLQQELVSGKLVLDALPGGIRLDAPLMGVRLHHL